MSQRAVEHCIGRLLTDTQFRRLARTSLAQACQQLGLELTVLELDLLSRLDFDSFSRLSCKLDPGLQRTGSQFV
jgi:hypothetical protein